MLKRPNYVEETNGAINKLFCKICGASIAGVTETPKGGGPLIKVMVQKFMRFSNYAEIKIEFSDGSMHVTNGCKSCLKVNMESSQLLEIYQADMAVMGMKPDRTPVKVVAIDRTGVGLL